MGCAYDRSVTRLSLIRSSARCLAVIGFVLLLVVPIAPTGTASAQSIDQQIPVNAPPGDSFWLVPAGPGHNTVQLLVDNVVVQVKASNNNVCAVLAGNALCDPVTGSTTVTWTLRNNDGGPATITNGGVEVQPEPRTGQLVVHFH